MPCTTLLVGKNASYDGSTMMARNEDSPSGSFTPKKFIVMNPKDQPRKYRSVLTKFHMDLPEEPMRYTAMPNALPEEGFWGEAGINEANVAMSETETITSNDRVLGADPLVKDGIGEEDMLVLVLPYIRSAREGVLRLGKLLETCGTCELNGIGFQDKEEIWWFESIGGHHWMTMPMWSCRTSWVSIPWIYPMLWAKGRTASALRTWTPLSGITTWTFP